MSKSKGLIWPYSIGLAITLVFGFCVTTVVVTQTANIQESDAYMTHYQDADANANDLIEAKIAFDKKYNVAFESNTISSDGSVLEYSVSNKSNTVVNNAELILAISRPETHDFDQRLENPTFKDGIYSFNNIKFAKAGVWNLVLKVQVADDYRFFDVKVDTRKNAKVDIRIKDAYKF